MENIEDFNRTCNSFPFSKVIILWHMLFLMIGLISRLIARGTRYKTNGTECESGKLEDSGKEGNTTPPPPPPGLKEVFAKKWKGV